MPKFSDFMIMIVVICAVATILLLIPSIGSSQYSVTYDNSSLAAFQNKTTVLYNITSNISNQSSSFTSQDSVFDILGSLTSQAFLAMKGAFVSIDLMTDLVFSGTGAVDMGPAGTIVRNTVITIILILLVIGVIIAMIVKWPV